jgi:general secretion pathway protein D
VETCHEEKLVTALPLMLIMLLSLLVARPMAAQQAERVGHAVAKADSINIHLVDVDLRTAVQALSRYLDRPVVLGSVGTIRITIETPRPIRAEDVPRLLRGVLESQNYELATDSTANLYRVQQREQSRALYAPDPAAVAAQQQRGALQLFVIHLRHARASDVAATVNAIYGRASALGELGVRPPTLTRDLQEQRISPAGAPAELPPFPGSRTATFSGDVTIVPDARTNSLLVRANKGDFALITAAVTELDVRPLQVLIEVMIAEVRKDRRLDFGVGADLGTTKIKHTENSTVEGALVGSSLGDLVIKVMGVGGSDINFAIRAAAARGDATILSRPILLAANNEPAEINVGSQRPFVQVSRVLPTDNTARDQVVQYKDVGTRLRIVPTISTDGYVMLQVSQEINAATAEQQFDAPIISTRSVETRLLVRDSQTVALGGLTDRQHEVSQGGVPFLSSIPLVGGLFGRDHRNATETELYLFLTPRIIRNDAEAEKITKPLEERARLPLE